MAASERLSLHVTILGCGYMGTALLRGWLQQDDSISFTACTRTKASAIRLETSVEDFSARSRVAFATCEDIVAALERADVVLLGFLPNDLKNVLSTPGVAKTLESKVVVSMLAGVSLAQIHEAIQPSSDRKLQLARIIPTIAASFGESSTLIAEDEASAGAPHMQTVERLFSLIGTTVAVPERLMDEATAIGAAIHALTIVAVDAATDASVASGVPRSTAVEVVTKSLQSAISLMTKGKMTPETVKAAMSTPAGITLNAVVDLDSTARSGIANGVTRAIKYTKGMST